MVAVQGAVNADQSGGKLKQWFWGCVSLHTGAYAMLGLNDVHNDAQQMISIVETLVVVASLQLGFFYPSFQEAATACIIVNEQQPLLGTLWFLSSFGSCVTYFMCSCTCMFIMIILYNVRSNEQAQHFITSAKTLILAPYRLWILASYLLMFGWALEAYIRCYGFMDFDSSSTGSHQGEYFAPRHAMESYWHLGVLGSGIFVIAFLFALCVCGMLVTKALQSHALFCAAQNGIMSSVIQDMNWFANPVVSELKQYLADYVLQFNESVRNPKHVQEFVLAVVQRHGYKSLSYIAARRLERLFEDMLEQALKEDEEGTIEPLGASHPEDPEVVEGGAAAYVLSVSIGRTFDEATPVLTASPKGSSSAKQHARLHAKPQAVSTLPPTLLSELAIRMEALEKTITAVNDAMASASQSSVLSDSASSELVLRMDRLESKLKALKSLESPLPMRLEEDTAMETCNAETTTVPRRAASTLPPTVPSEFIVRLEALEKTITAVNDAMASASQSSALSDYAYSELALRMDRLESKLKALKSLESPLPMQLEVDTAMETCNTETTTVPQAAASTLPPTVPSDIFVRTRMMTMRS